MPCPWKVAGQHDTAVPTQRHRRGTATNVLASRPGPFPIGSLTSSELEKVKQAVTRWTRRSEGASRIRRLANSSLALRHGRTRVCQGGVKAERHGPLHTPEDARNARDEVRLGTSPAPTGKQRTAANSDSSIDSNAMRSVTVRRSPSTLAEPPERPLRLPCWLLLISGLGVRFPRGAPSSVLVRSTFSTSKGAYFSAWGRYGP
jgi:hypothetical protein